MPLIASTTGEGDPPDRAIAFVNTVMTTRPDLRALQIGVLAACGRLVRSDPADYRRDLY